MEKKVICDVVLNHVKMLNETLSPEKQFEINLNTIIFGKGSSIDSLSLVSLIIDLEMSFSEEFGHTISLTDDRAMTREISPFDTITSLTDYIYELVNP